MSTMRLLGCAVLWSLGVGAAHGGGCQASAEVRRFWVEQGGFVQKASLHVKVRRARPDAYVSVHVDSRFHYERSDGWTNRTRTSDSIGIATRHSASASLVIDARAVNCSQEAPCVIHDVEIVQLQCFD